MHQCAIYARYSSHAQREVSIDQQIKACRDFAARQGLEVVAVYEDHAISGTSDNRPQFQRMIADSANADWQYLIVYALDRFARDRYDSAVYKRKLRDNGVKVLSSVENLTDDPSGILLESVLEGLAEYYSKELAQKTARGMADNAHRCMVNGPLPIGYINKDGKYAIYEPEAAIVREIYNRAEAGEQLAAIYRDLTARDVRTRKNTPIGRNQLQKALSNERYTGTYIYGDIRIEDGIPAIISKEQYRAVQLALGGKPNPRTVKEAPIRRKREYGLYLLTGKLYCGDCQSPMVGISGRSTGNGANYHYYACKGQRSGSCDKKAVRRDEIEQAITEAIQKHILNEETIDALADALIAREREKAKTAELETVTAALTDTRKSIQNIIKAIESGIFTQSIQKRLWDLEQQEEQLAAKAHRLSESAALIPDRESLITLLTMFATGDPTDKTYQQILLDAFLLRAYIYSDHFDLVITLGDAKTKTIPIPLATTISEAIEGAESLYKLPSGSPTKLIQTKSAQIVVYSDIFVARFLRGKRHHA